MILPIIATRTHPDCNNALSRVQPEYYFLRGLQEWADDGPLAPLYLVDDNGNFILDDNGNKIRVN